MLISLENVLTLEDREPDHVVKGLVYQGQMLVLAGEPGVGKSFLMYNMAMSIASGKSFLGMETTQGPVLYFDEENSSPDLAQYLRWTWRGMREPPIDALQAHLSIEHFALVREGRKRFEYMAKRAEGVKPLLIVIDTASPACDIKDENDNAEAGRMISRLRAIKESAGPQCTMLILKHAKLDHEEGKRTIRGAKAWLGALDGVLYHTLPAGQPRKDGLRNTHLMQDKVRAFGLKETLKIAPEWTGSGTQKGIVLNLK